LLGRPSNAVLEQPVCPSTLPTSPPRHVQTLTPMRTGEDREL
jgi:hypothetical protein